MNLAVAVFAATATMLDLIGSRDGGSIVFEKVIFQGFASQKLWAVKIWYSADARVFCNRICSESDCYYRRIDNFDANLWFCEYVKYCLTLQI